MNHPLISCIIPTFNRSSLLKEAIESTLKQTFADWELIIVDDGSIDDTEQIVNSYVKQDQRISYWKNTKKGPASARNLGVSKANSNFILFLDDDDISLPHRFQNQYNAILKSGKEFIVSGYEVRYRGANKLISSNLNELKGNGAGFPSRWIISKSLFEKAGGFDEEIVPMEDPDLSYRIAQYETFAYHYQIVTIMHTSPDSISSLGKTLNAKVKMMEKSAHLMLPIEAAWWYFVIAQDFYTSGNSELAKKYLSLAATIDSRGLYKLAYRYFLILRIFGNPFKKMNNKLLKTIRDYHFPTLVEHELIY